MNVGHAPSSELHAQVRSQRALISALSNDTIWAVSVEARAGRAVTRRGLLSHNGEILRFESWDGSIFFAVSLSKDLVKRKSGNRVAVVDRGRRWTLREPQDLKLVMSGSPALPRRIADPTARFMGLFESIN